MNAEEQKRILGYIKKRYDECDMDYQTFNGDIDMTLTYIENKNIIDKHLETMLPAKVSKSMEDEQVKAELEKQMRAEQEKKEAEIKAREEAEVERIKNIPNGEEELKIFNEMDNLIKQVIIDKKTRGLLLHGASSLGKTFRVRKAMANNKVPYVLHSGHITEMKFYIKCFQNADKIHIFDDENILHSKTFLNMIKAMLNGETGLVEYDTSRKFPSDVKSSFEFTGKVIIILNDLPRNDEHFKAVKNRVINYELSLDRQQRLNLLYERAKNENIEGITKEERIKVVDWIKDNSSGSTLNLNYRLYEKAINFYIHQREDWKALTQTQIEGIDEYTMLILMGVDSQEEWCNKTGKGRSSYYVYKQKAKKLETGLLDITGLINSDDKTLKIQQSSNKMRMGGERW